MTWLTWQTDFDLTWLHYDFNLTDFNFDYGNKGVKVSQLGLRVGTYHGVYMFLYQDHDMTHQ